jgi:hypothetical protein
MNQEMLGIPFSNLAIYDYIKSNTTFILSIRWNEIYANLSIVEFLILFWIDKQITD